MIIDRAALADHRRAINRYGEQVIVERLAGFAPNITVTATATLQARIMKYEPDRSDPDRTGLSASSPGGITQGLRIVIMMAADLAAAGFPVPLAKNDRITLSSTGEQTNVSEVDMSKRAFAGALEAKIAGVA